MAVTPLIKPIANHTGMFYAFQSALNHSNLIGSQQGLNFKFSKYALINIPTFGSMTGLENRFNPYAIGESPLIDGIPDNSGNKVLAESFENYCLNLEAVLLSQKPSYNTNIEHTVAERVFFKWLKEAGAIRFRKASSLEKVSTQSGNRYVEEDEYVQTISRNWEYNRIVKLIADIPAVNVNKQDNVYTELYISTPAEAGSTPTIMFKSVSDDNYLPNTVYINPATSAQDSEYLCGRHYNNTHPYSLSMKAYYDYDDGTIQTLISSDIETTPTVQGNWFNETVSNSYHTDDTDKFDSADNLRILKRNTDTGIEKEYVRSYLDGITIDWDTTNYKLYVEDATISSWSNFNASASSKDFQFNAMLVYYDLVGPDGTTITNLYGIQFFNMVEFNGTDFHIPVTTKYRPNPISQTNGTGFTPLINIKTDSSVANVGVERSINDSSPASFDKFMSALTSLQTSADVNINYLSYIIAVYNEVVGLKALMTTNTNTAEIEQRLKSIEDSLSASSALLSNSEAYQRQISTLFDLYNNILDNKTTLDVKYNLDSATINSMVSLNQSYNSMIVGGLSNQSENVIQLAKYANYYKHKTIGNILTLDYGDVTVKIDDSVYPWAKYQTYDFVFDTEVVTNGFSINILTDYYGKAGSGAYGVTAAVFSSEFDDGKLPIIRLTCLDDVKMIFDWDVIRVTK